MIRILFAAFVLFFIVNPDLTSQTIARKKDPIIMSVAEKCNISIEEHTYFAGLFAQMKGGASFSIGKSQDQYYLFVEYSSLPLNSYDPQHSLNFHLDNKDVLKFQPISEPMAINKSGVSTIYTTALTSDPNNPIIILSSSMNYSVDNVYFVYRITREELETLSVNDLNSVSLVFDSGSVIKEGYSNSESNNTYEKNTGILGRFMRKSSKLMLEL